MIVDAVVSSIKKDLRTIALFIFLVSSLCSHAQQMAGVWEGDLLLNGNKKTTMKIRMEIMEQENNYYGILYSRGVDKSVVYGCDYFITGLPLNGRFSFKWQNVQRAIRLKQSDCESFEQLLVGIKKVDSSFVMEGNWVWAEGRADLFKLVKVSDMISDMAADEVETYLRHFFEQYEQMGVRLPEAERMQKRIRAIEVDSNDLVIELSTIDSLVHDSITVLVNGEPVAVEQNLFSKPVRIRLKSPPIGSSDVVVVNASLIQQKVRVRMQVSQRNQQNELILESSFAINAWVVFNRKQE